VFDALWKIGVLMIFRLYLNMLGGSLGLGLDVTDTFHWQNNFFNWSVIL
jgi:hypothetical protein